MDNSTSYKPIQCAIHDRFELACMRQAIHKVTWSEQGGERTEPLRFLDLDYTQSGEFLLAENQSGERLRLRLDQISCDLPY